MKKLLLVIALLISINMYSQTSSGCPIFNIGDTITLTYGSLPNGSFASTNYAPATRALNGDYSIQPLDARWTNTKHIIEKIKIKKVNKLSSSTFLIIKITPLKYTVEINLDQAIQTNELK